MFIKKKRCPPTQYFDTLDSMPKCSNFYFIKFKILQLNFEFFNLKENKKTSFGNCSDLEGECEATVGLSCQQLPDGGKACQYCINI